MVPLNTNRTCVLCKRFVNIVWTELSPLKVYVRLVVKTKGYLVEWIHLQNSADGYFPKKILSPQFLHIISEADSIPIMTYLYENAILPKVITTSAVSQCKIKFLDSLNFLPMRLADLPDVFGKENQNIILEHLPDMEYYNPNAMKPEDRFSDGNSVLL